MAKLLQFPRKQRTREHIIADLSFNHVERAILKAGHTAQRLEKDYVFDLDVRDYHLWRVENYPVFLILYDATQKRAYWLHVQGYFQAEKERQPAKGAKTVRVEVPRRQVINKRGMAAIRG